MSSLRTGEQPEVPAISLVLLSPHLDDVVLSAFSRLGPGTTVVNVYDGVPPEGTLSLWDKVCGATSSAEQARARLAEDESVLSSLGAERRGCGLLDALNRERDPERDREEVADVLEELVSLDGLVVGRPVLAPLAGGPRQHPDHRLVRDAALALLRVGAIPSLTLYGDVPYCCKGGGWPRSLGGSHDDPRWLGRLLREVPLGSWLDAARVDLDPEQADRKLAAMRGYVTQFENLDRRLRTKGLVSDPAIYGAEVLVSVGRPALSR